MSAGDPKPVSVRRELRPHCIGARDRGVAMRVLVLERTGGTVARCAGVDGIAARVETALVAPVEPGAVLFVQGGIALLRLDTEWAI